MNFNRGAQARVPGPRAVARACPWAQALAASFVVPGDPKADLGSCDPNLTSILR